MKSRVTVVAVMVFAAVDLAAQTPATRTFIPERFYNTFSFAHPPAMRIKPGERIVTKTADAAGVRPGDVLLKLDDIDVRPTGESFEAIRSRYRGKGGQPLRVTVRRGDQTLTLSGTVREHVQPSRTIRSRQQMIHPAIVACGIPYCSGACAHWPAGPSRVRPRCWWPA